MLNISTSKFGSSTTAEDVLKSIDLTNKTILITGVTSGLGAESARTLSARGAKIIGLSRTPSHNVDVPIECDLTDVKQLRDAIDKIINYGKKIDAILCNAGVMALPQLEQVMGYEKQFFVNHLSHFFLVTELLNHLSDNARIVLVSSEGHRLAKNLAIDFENLTGESYYNAWRAYGQSKLANILFVQFLAEQFKHTQKIAIAVHPGMITTQLNRYLPTWQRLLLLPIELFATKSIPCGAATQVFAIAHPDAIPMNGCYITNCHVKSVPKKLAMAEQLWQKSMEIKKKLGFDNSIS